MKPHILIKLPSRGRATKFFKALDSIHNNIRDLDNFSVSCTLDVDDPIMAVDDVIKRIEGYRNTTIAWGKSDSKVHAINRSVPVSGWDVLVISSDDIYFSVFGFDEIIRAELAQHFPDGDAYLHFKEKDSGAALNVMTVIDRKYYDRFNFVYNPEYLSLFCDDEQMGVAKILGRYIYIDYSIMEHRNPAYNEYNEVKDALFIYQQELGWSVDKDTFERRKLLNFDL